MVSDNSCLTDQQFSCPSRLRATTSEANQCLEIKDAYRIGTPPDGLL
jgi:hypothetical protein